MLETLKIKNIAIIDSAEIPFDHGLNILSGETGAGKSIVIEAISLILGSRAAADLIRSGCDEATVEGIFSVKELPWVQERLKEFGFPDDDGTLLIKRVVSRSGKHRIYVNGELATLSNLQKICEGLVDLCGQHEHQSLLKSATQIELLDRFGGLTKETETFQRSFENYRAKKQALSELLGDEGDRVRRADFLRFQIEELKSAELLEGEDEKLQIEKSLLQSSESRLSHGEAIRQALENEEASILNFLRTATTKARTLAQVDPKSAPIREALERALVEAEDASVELNRYLDGVDLDPSRLEAVQDRLSRIAELRRKYGGSVSDILGLLENLENELSKLENTENLAKGIQTEITELGKEVLKLAKSISLKRSKIAQALSASVTAELKDLRMGEAEFSIELAFSEDVDSYSPRLAGNSIQYLVRTNKGEESRPIGKIASGGELSRMMLAIRRVIADRGGIGVYLFDEIDAGIGGQTGFEVGRKLKSVASHNQVLCITHLPQVAAFADHHLSVRKMTQGDRTRTVIVELGKKERKEEVARMLGGPELTKKSLENAAELLDTASS